MVIEFNDDYGPYLAAVELRRRHPRTAIEAIALVPTRSGPALEVAADVLRHPDASEVIKRHGGRV
jgi:hypothetical protein